MLHGALPDLVARLRLDDADLDAGVGRVKSSFSKLSVAFAAVGVGLLKVGKDSLAAFGDSEKVVAQTGAVLKSTGGAAGVTAKQVGDLAARLQKLSGVEDEAIQAGQNMLLTFTNLRNEAGAGNDVFNQATRTLLDMSVALGTDAKTSAIQLGKALNDPIAGIGALSRVGVTFTDEQKSLIKTLVESGDVMGAQKIILAELNKEFGGSAKAAGDAQTPMERLTLRLGDMQEKIGAFLVPALERLTTVALGVIEWVSALDPRVLAIVGTIAGLVAIVLAISKAIEIWTAVQAALNAVLALNPIVLVGLAIAALVAGLVIAYKSSETFRDIVDGAFRAVATAAGFMRDVAVGALRFLVDAFLAVVETIVGAGARAFGWVPGIGPKLEKAANDIERFRDEANAALGGIRDKVVTVTINAGPAILGSQPVRPVPAGSGAILRRAHGGPVLPGRPYIVGEVRPELFVPDVAGRIEPTVPGGGGIAVYSVVNVAGSIADEAAFAAILDRRDAELVSALRAGRR